MAEEAADGRRGGADGGLADLGMCLCGLRVVRDCDVVASRGRGGRRRASKKHSLTHMRSDASGLVNAFAFPHNSYTPTPYP